MREAAAARNVWANIPNRSNRKQRFALSPWLYKQRNLVEHFFSRIKQSRGIATRYDKDPANFLAAIKIVCARHWCAALSVCAPTALRLAQPISTFTQRAGYIY